MSDLETTDTSVETVSDDLDAFSADFFGQKPSTEDGEAKPPENDEIEKDTSSDAPNTERDDSQETDSTDTDTEDEAPENTEDKPKPKNRFQERIDELTGGKRQAERERDELAARIRELEAKSTTPPVQEPTKTTPQPSAEGPTPMDTNEDGTDKYPLGEFDPGYIRDMVRHQHSLLMAEQAKEKEQEAVENAKNELRTDWQHRMDTAQERYPDLTEKAQGLVPVFQGVDPSYEEYLATTLMGLENGPDVLYHLSNNIDEARSIIAMGPVRATIALAKLEARLQSSVETGEVATPTEPRPKVSQAPTPPPTNKGAAPAKLSVPDDTDDLDAFTKKFFKRR